MRKKKEEETLLYLEKNVSCNIIAAFLPHSCCMHSYCILIAFFLWLPRLRCFCFVALFFARDHLAGGTSAWWAHATGTIAPIGQAGQVRVPLLVIDRYVVSPAVFLIATWSHLHCLDRYVVSPAVFLIATWSCAQCVRAVAQAWLEPKWLRKKWLRK